MLQQIFFAPPPGALERGQISFNFNYKVNNKDFYTKLCVCVCGGGGGGGGVNFFFFKHDHVAYQIDGDDEQNRMQVKFSS